MAMEIISTKTIYDVKNANADTTLNLTGSISVKDTKISEANFVINNNEGKSAQYSLYFYENDRYNKNISGDTSIAVDAEKLVNDTLTEFKSTINTPAKTKA